MIDKMREENYSVDELCEAFEVSRSGYYAARKRPPSQRAKENEIIVSKMKEIHSDRHLKAYGSPRMTTELQEEHGLACSENRVARLMANNDLKARHKASFRPKTTVQDGTQKASPNILANTEKPSAPGQICVSDITYVATREGWLYLAVVIDLYSRAVVGWSIAESMHTFLVSSALAKSMTNLPPGSRPLFHSDRGCQYTSKEFRKLLKLYGLPQSMSAKGYCYDNAVNESFFASLKRESFPEDCCFETKAEARRTIFDYLEVFYHKRRRHSSLGNVSPETFLNQHFQTQKTHLN
jgi:transposase InsO family protein